MTFNPIPGSVNYFMNKAFQFAMKSEDPNTRVGACIVNENGEVVGLGHNRAPGRGVPIPWNSDTGKEPTEEQWLNSKYPYVLHDEMDAILNKTCSSLNGCTMYTLIFPWNECAKLIIESGINKVVYYYDKYPKSKYMRASKALLGWANVVCTEFKPENTENLQFFEEMASKTVKIV